MVGASSAAVIMKWLTTYNDWSAKIGGKVADAMFDFFEFASRENSTMTKYTPAIGMTLVIGFIAFVVFLGLIGELKI